MGQIKQIITLLLFQGLLGLSMSNAWATTGSVFEGEGLIEILPVGDVFADGEKEVSVFVVALDSGGAPIDGLKLKLTADQGKASGWKAVDPGIYQFSYKPEAVDVAQQATIKANGRTPDRQTVSTSLQVRLVPAVTRELGIQISPADGMVLGQTQEGMIQVSFGGGDFGKMTAEDLAISVGSGEVVNLTPMGPGKFAARYLAPKVNFPHFSIVTVADQREPDGTVGMGVIPLYGSVEYPVNTRPGSSVILKIGNREFGPVVADADGKASIAIVVPPGVSKGMLRSLIGGQTVEEPFDLRIPETKRIKVFPLPRTIPAEANVKIPVRVAVLAQDGTPHPSAQLSITASAGEMTEAQSVGNGVYLSHYSPPAGTVQMPVTIDAAILGTSDQKDSQSTTLVPGRASQILLTPEPEELMTGNTALNIYASVKGPDGKGLDGRTVAFFSQGATQKGDTKDLRSGDYEARFSATLGTSAEVNAMVLAPPSSNPLRHIVLMPAKTHVANDGGQSVRVGVFSLDAFGYPVPQTSVDLRIDQGDGAFPTQVKTDANGMAQVYYTSGEGAGLVRLRAQSGGYTGTTAMIQAPRSLVVPTLPSGGQEADHRVLAALQEMQTTVSIPRQGVDESLVAAAAATDPSGGGESLTSAEDRSAGKTIVVLDVTVDPTSVSPGSQVTVNVTALDANGRGVQGEAPDFLSTRGSFLGVSESGDGSYQNILNVPGDAEGQVKVSVVSPNGVSSFIAIPVLAKGAVAEDEQQWGGKTDEGGLWKSGGEAPEEQGEDLSAGESAEKEKKTKVSPGDHPWFRVRASGIVSFYEYTQTPTETSGSLLSQRLSLGDGQAGAMPLGFEIDARAWVMPYVGIHTSWRLSTFTLESTAFDGELADWLLHGEASIIGRYPIDIGKDQFWIGGKVGYSHGDILVFQGCLASGCEISYSSAQLPGLLVGGEMGAEIGPIHGIVSVGQSFANGQIPFATLVDFGLGWDVYQGLSIEAGVSASFRQIGLEGDQSGELRGTLEDRQSIIKLGLGYAL